MFMRAWKECWRYRQPGCRVWRTRRDGEYTRIHLHKIQARAAMARGLIGFLGTQPHLRFLLLPLTILARPWKQNQDSQRNNQRATVRLSLEEYNINLTLLKKLDLHTNNLWLHPPPRPYTLHPQIEQRQEILVT